MKGKSKQSYDHYAGGGHNSAPGVKKKRGPGFAQVGIRGEKKDMVKTRIALTKGPVKF